jgi:hypothetical protein
MCTSSLIDYATAPTQTTSACCILSPIGCTTGVLVQLQPKRFALLNGTLSVNVPFETSLVPSLSRLTSRALVAVSLKEKDVAPMGCHDYTAMRDEANGLECEDGWCLVRTSCFILVNHRYRSNGPCRKASTAQMETSL